MDAKIQTEDLNGINIWNAGLEFDNTSTVRCVHGPQSWPKKDEKKNKRTNFQK